MGKIRINDLARELEVKSKAILDVLPQVGVTEKKTHSSSIEEHEAVKVREYLQSHAEPSAGSRSSRPARPDDEIKTKIDLSHISKPGDVLSAIRAKQQTPAAARAAPAASVVESRQATSTAVKPPAPVAPKPQVAPTPRLVVPQATPRPTFTVPPPAAPQPPAASAPPAIPAPPRPAGSSSPAATTEGPSPATTVAQPPAAAITPPAPAA